MIRLHIHWVICHETRHNDPYPCNSVSILPTIPQQRCPTLAKLVVHWINPCCVGHIGRRRIPMATKYDP
jgi:hypothetical protein